MRLHTPETLAAVLFVAGTALAQGRPADSAGPASGAAPQAAPPIGVPAAIRALRQRGLRLDCALQDAARLARTATLAEVRGALGAPFVQIADDGRAHVEIVAPEGREALPRGWVSAFGGRADTRWRNRLDAWMPLATLLQAANALPPGHRIERAQRGQPDAVVGEGPSAIGSDVYQSGGANGTGLVVAVVDGGYTGLSAARANGDAPALSATTTVNLTPNSFESGGTHGTGCVEAAYDHAPGATWRLYKVDSLADLGTAVSDAVANGADVITHSASYYNTGWADDSGSACGAALQAASAGVPFCTSAGNRAQQHWQGLFNDPGGDGFHDFAPGDETIDVEMPAGASGTYYLCWDTGAGTADYDLELWDQTLTTLLASSTNSGNTFESLWLGNSGTTSIFAHLVVRKKSGANVDMELFEHGGGIWLEHAQAQGSTTSPSNTTHANVISVGAVDWSSFGAPAGATGILEAYSSQGPSNSGMTLPDLCGPTNTQGFTYPASAGGFGGTSAATPNVAGALCAFRSSVPAFDGAASRWLLLEQARLGRDWGPAGADNQYGQGGAALAPFAASTTWLARGYGNTGELATGPYYTLAAAHAAAVAGGRILVLPSFYPEAPVVLTKALVLESYGGSALLGP